MVLSLHAYTHKQAQKTKKKTTIIMKIIQLLLNLIVFPLTLVGMCFILPPYWVFQVLSFLKRSLFPEDVKGKVILITGASSGIGEHVAYEYAKRGACLVLAARRKDRLLAVAEKARELGSPDTLVVSVDVSIAENCEQMVQETINHFGRVDHLVNNAGICLSKLFEECSDIKEMKSTTDINFWGAVHTTRSAMPHLRRSKGKIVVVSSTASWLPTPRLSIYNGSKGALVSLFDTMRVEVGGDVKITLVCPGFIDTEMITICKNLIEDEWWINFLKRTRFPVAKVEGCAEAIVKSACRGDRYLTEPKWMLVTYWIKLLCPELMEFFLRFLMIDSYKKFL